MSQTIDQKVVEMKFDNKQFESNVKTSMSSIDKLKQSLNFDGVSKGLDTVSSAAKSCDVSALGRAAETVQAKFGALEVMAVTALVNITNSAVNAGKRIVSALTIQFPKDGLAEYELQINSTQTIMANTGRTVQDVNAALDKLNEYADLTIYNFSEMTKNAGMFTSAGLGLEDTMIALKGVGNWAAFAGANSQQMGNATYQLGQALNAGAVRLQDWMSIEKSAGMAGKKYKEAFVETAQQMGKLNKNFDMSKFRETLKKGWLTTEVFLETMKKFANDPSMTDAATKVKTFTQLIDTLKEALGTGWASSWRLIIGDFEEAKDLFTSISDALSTIINEASETRNAILLGGFGSKWKQLTAKITEAGISTNAWDEQLSRVLEKHGFDIDALIEQYGSLGAAFSKGVAPTEYLQEAVDGLYNSLADLSGITKDLSKGDKGDNVAEAQKALKTLGYNLGEFGKEADGVDGIFGKMTKSAVEAFQIANELEVTGIIDEKTLNALREASDSSRLILDNLGELVSLIAESGGRENLIAALQNSFKALTDVIKNVKKAWNDVFHPGASEEDIIKEKANMILRITEAIRNFSERLKINDDVAEKLQKTFKGLFSILSIVKSIIGAGINVVMGLLSKLTGQVNIDLLGFTATIGDSFVKFKEWLDENDVIAKTFERIIGWVSKAVDKIKEWFQYIRSLESVNRIVTLFRDSISSTFNNLKEYFSGGISAIRDFIERVKALGSINMNNIGTVLKDFYDNVIGYFADTTGLFKPISTAFEKLESIIAPYLEKIQEYFTSAKDGIKKWSDVVIEKLGNVIESLKKFFSGVTWKDVANVAALLGVILFLIQVYKAIRSFTNLTDALQNVFSTISKFVSAQKSRLAVANFKDLAIAVGIIAASIFVLAQLDWKEAWKAAVAVGGIIVVLLGVQSLLMLMSKKMGSMGELKMVGFSKSILSLSIGICILVKALKNLSGVSWEDSIDQLKILGVMLAGLTAAGMLLGIVGGKLSGVAFTMLAFAGALWLLVSVLKSDAFPSLSDCEESLNSIFTLIGIFTILLSIIGLFTKTSNLVGASLLLLTFVGALFLMKHVLDMYAKDLSTINSSLDTIERIAGIMIVVVGLIGLLNKSSKGLINISAVMISFAGSLWVIAKALTIFQDMEWKDILKGLAVFGAVAIGLLGLVFLLRGLQPGEATGVFAVLISFVAGLLVLMGAVIVLGSLSEDMLIRGVSSVTVVLLALGAAMKLSEKVGSKQWGSLLVMALAVATFCACIMFLKDVPWYQLLASAGALSILMVALGGSVALAGKGTWQGATGLLAAAVAIAALAASLYLLKDIDWLDMGVKMLILVGALYLLVGAGHLAEGAVAGLAILSIALLSIGASILLTAAGFYIFAEALNVVGEAMPKITESMIPFANALVEVVKILAPCWVDMLKVGLATLVLGAGLLVVASAAMVVALAVLTFSLALAIVGSTINAIAIGLGALGVGIQNLVNAVTPCQDSMEAFRSVMETMATTIADFLLKIAGGTVTLGLAAVVLGAGCIVLGASLVVVGAGILVIGAALLVLSLGILAVSGSLVVLANSFQKAVGIVRATLSTMGSASEKAGQETSNSFAKGLISTLSACMSSATLLVGSVIGKICELLGIHSPSKVTQRLGYNTGKGYSLGLDDSKSDVETSASGIVDKITEFFGKTTPTLQDKGSEAGAAYASGVEEGAGDTDFSSYLQFIPEEFREKFKSFGSEAGSGFSLGVEDGIGSFNIDDLTSSLEGSDMSSITEMFNSKGFDLGEGFSSNLEDGIGSGSIENGLSSMLSGIDDKNSEFKDAGSEIDNSIIDGIKENETSLIEAITTVIENLITTIKKKNDDFKMAGKGFVDNLIEGAKSKYEDLKSAGSYLVDGFVKGINNDLFKSTEAGKEIAAKAVEAARKELDEHSPSKVGYQIGDYFGVAFVNAIGDYASKAYSAGSDLAAKAKTGLSETISKVSDLLSSDIDSQPTIRPVLDLSDVKSGADELNRMTNGYSLARSIQLAQSSSALMSGNAVSNSFGIADQVKALAQTLAGQSPTSIQNEFNITGDNPQEIANAVAEIIQQQIERRDAVWA